MGPQGARALGRKSASEDELVLKLRADVAQPLEQPVDPVEARLF
jgi:hypothetical protein